MTPRWGVLLLLSSLAALSGCVAELVQKKNARKGPVPEVGYIDPGGGEVRYSAEGWGFFVGWRRKAALRKMRGVCKGKGVPVVTEDYAHQDADAVYSGEELDVNMEHGMEHYRVGLYQHIVFDCRPLPDKGKAK